MNYKWNTKYNLSSPENMKKIIRCLTIVCFCCIYYTASAQPPPPPPPGPILAGNVPIDTDVAFLLIALASFGVYKIYKSKQQFREL